MDASGTAGLYYKHSGKFSVSGVLFTVVVGSLIASFCAFLYAYAVLYLPFIYINALIAAGFGGICGFTAAALLKKKKVRSDAVALAVTLVVTSVAFYFGWAVWVWALIRRAGGELHLADLGGLVLQPWVVWELVLEVNKTGAWSLRGGSPVTGMWLWLTWLAELGIIFGCSLYVAYHYMEEESFCESCETWATKKEKVLEAVTPDVNEFKQRMEAKDFRYLENAGPPSGESMEWQRIDVFSCAKCGSFHTLDSTQVKIKVESGKRKEETKQTMHHLLLTASEADALQKLGAKMTPPPPPEVPKGASASA